MDTSLFNKPQLQAIEYCDGPSLVIAGAGSGKTRVLTYKIAYLIERGYAPWNILALTFTNKAADEMKDRIAKIVGEKTARYLWMGTFHSIFLRILRTECDRIGFQPGFTIYDAADSKSLVKSIIKELHLDDKTYKPSSVLARISAAKNQLITAKQYAANMNILQSDMRGNMPAIHDIYTMYYNRCRNANAMDFDDILLYTFYLFHLHKDVRDKYSEMFQYVLVDEYQDTNHAQHQIVLQLTDRHQHICVVGDDAQSIYSFRGARIDNILSFQNVYPDTHIFKLEQNYRSTQTIVNAANSLIHKNQGQIYKNVFSEKSVGNKIELTEAFSDIEEAEITTRRIQWLHSSEHLDYSDIAVLYRTNAQSRLFEESLRKANIPYRIYGGLSFYQRKEIKDVIAYFRLAVNPNDEEALKRVINYPSRGIGDTTLSKVVSCAEAHDTSLWSVLCNPATSGLNVSNATLARLISFRELIQQFIDKAAKENAEAAGRHIIENCGILADIYQDRNAENLSRQENVEELLNGLSDFCETRMEEGNTAVSLTDYLSEVSLISDLDNDTDKKEGETDNNRIRLMTIHMAKGLEFQAVFIVGLEEGLFPNEMCNGNRREIEEERRLFYVAVTRAMQYLYISYAKSRYHYGKMEFGEPSRFLHDIESCYLNVKRNGGTHYGGNGFGIQKRHSDYSEPEIPWKKNYTGTNTPPANFRKVSSINTHSNTEDNKTYRNINSASSASATERSNTTATRIQPGQHIQHDRFGIGVVLCLEGEGDSLKATVKFQNSGTKQLLLKYARFTIIDK